MKRMLLCVAAAIVAANASAYQTYRMWWYDDLGISADNYVGFTIDDDLWSSMNWETNHNLTSSETTHSVELAVDSWNRLGAVSPNLYVIGTQQNLPGVGADDGINTIGHNACNNIAENCGPIMWTRARTYMHFWYNLNADDYVMIGGDIIFAQDSFPFTTYATIQSPMDNGSFFRVLSHEMGHVYSLGHTDENYEWWELMEGEGPQSYHCEDPADGNTDEGPLMCSSVNRVWSDVPLEDDVVGLQSRQVVRDGAVRFTYMNTVGGIGWDATSHIIDANWVTKYEPRIACNPTNGPTPDCAVSSISGSDNRITLSTVTGGVGQLSYRQAYLNMNNSSIRSVDVAMRPRNNDGEIVAAYRDTAFGNPVWLVRWQPPSTTAYQF